MSEYPWGQQIQDQRKYLAMVLEKLETKESDYEVINYVKHHKDKYHQIELRRFDGTSITAHVVRSKTLFAGPMHVYEITFEKH